MDAGASERRAIELRVDVADAIGVDQAEMAATVWLPDPVPEAPVVCFGLPGGGYARRYWSFDLPGCDGDGQAGYHVDRGWVVVTVDHLGVGESTMPDVPVELEVVAASTAALVDHVVGRLASGDLAAGVGPRPGPTVLGFGQSMGAHFVLVTQAHRRSFHGIALLGSSAIQTVVPTRPGSPPLALPWVLRTTASGPAPVILNPDGPGAGGAGGVGPADGAGENPLTWAFHFDDEDPDVVALDMAGDPPPPWRSATIPSCAGLGVVPGVVASEAASVTVPVFVGTGERDVVPNPWMEPFAYRSSPDVTVFVCPGMAHLHNFATTRERLWRRLHHWGTGVAADRAGAGPTAPPTGR